jgi:hypothetical protein
MLARIEHGEYTSLGEVGEPEVPLAFHVLGTNLVDLFEGI